MDDSDSSTMKKIYSICTNKSPPFCLSIFTFLVWRLIPFIKKQYRMWSRHYVYLFQIWWHCWLFNWLVVLGIYVALAVLQPYHNLEAGDNQSLKLQVARPGFDPRPLAPQAKSLFGILKRLSRTYMQAIRCSTRCRENKQNINIYWKEKETHILTFQISDLLYEANRESTKGYSRWKVE